MLNSLSFRRAGLLPAVIAMTTLSLISQAFSQPPVAPAIRLQDAIARVLESNPKLQGQRYTLLGAEARRNQAALRPAYTLGLDVENVLGTGQTGATRSMEATLRLGTVIELGEKRQRRVSVSDRERENLTVENDAVRLDILAETARRFIAVLAEQERLTLALESQELAKQTVGLVKQRVSQGRAASVENNTAMLALMQAEIAVAEQDSALANAWGTLAVTWGGAPEELGRGLGSLFDLPAPANFSALKDAIVRNPTILRFASERRVNEAKLRLAEASRTPDLSVGLGIRRLEVNKDQALVLSASIPLGSAGRSTPYEREAQSRLQQGSYEEAAARADLTGSLYGLYVQLESARIACDKLQRVAIPEAAQAARLTDEGFRAGRFSLLELTVARQSFLTLRQQAVSRAATYHQLFLEIERLTGETLRLADAPIAAR